jgi:very-short-patch-repair endonuclease
MPNVKKAASFEKLVFAREQRHTPSRAEDILWAAVRGSQLGAKFRRQHPLGLFVLDFYCDQSALAVEVDGPLHEGQEEYDAWRDAVLGEQGIRTLRFRNEVVEGDLRSVLDEILLHLTA